MEEASRERTSNRGRRVRRRRHRSRFAGLKRQLKPAWYEIRSIVRSSTAYRWILGTAVALGLLIWLAEIVLPSSNPDRYRPGQQGRLAR
jgi:hypothetical protein